MRKVTDPNILAQLNGSSAAPPVTDYNGPQDNTKAMQDLYGGGEGEPAPVTLQPMVGGKKKVTDPAVLAQLEAPAVDAAPNVKAPVEKGFADSIGSNAHSALTKRGIGLIQVMDSLTGGSILDDAHRAAIPGILAKLDEEEKGTGIITGTIANIASDPINWVGGPGSVVTKGAIMGAAGAATAPSAENQGLLGRAEDAAIGGAVGGVVGKGAQYLGGKTKDLAAGINNRFLTMFGVNDAADRIVYRKLAEKLVADGLEPEEVLQKLAQAEKSGLNPTLAEATGSRGAMQYEKSVSAGAGKGATTFNKNLMERGKTTIPGVLEKGAADLRGPAGSVDAAYDAAKAEGNATIANSIRTPGAQPAIAPPGGSMANPQLLDKLTQTLESVQNGISGRLSELGSVNNVESKALKQAQAIMDNAKKRGGSFDALLDAKKQLNDLFIEGADTNSQKAASRYVAKYGSELDGVLGELAPSAYPVAKTAAKSTMAARSIEDSLGDAKIGNIGKVVADVWGSPDARAEFLAKLPDQAAKEKYTAVFDMLDNISQGMGGRARPVNSGGVLPSDFRGVKTQSFSPLGIIPGVVRNVGETFTPKLYERATEAAWKPDAGRLAYNMNNLIDGSPLGRLVSSILGGQAGQAATEKPR